MTSSCVHRGFLICVSWLLGLCPLCLRAHWYVSHSIVKRVSFLITTWLLHACIVAFSYVGHDSWVCALFFPRAHWYRTHSCVWHDSVVTHMCVSLVTHIWMSRVTHITHSIQYVVVDFRVSEKHNPHISGVHTFLVRNSNLVISIYTLIVHSFILRYSHLVRLVSLLVFSLVHSV